jgi:hypothetical protein
MTTTATPAPIRYLGKCQVKRCQTKRAIEPGTARTRLFPGGVLTVLDESGRDWPLYEIGDRDQVKAMRDAGFVCAEHDVVVWFRPGRFTYNPEKVCNAACMGAVGPACDCSCSGSNHGGNHL